MKKQIGNVSPLLLKRIYRLLRYRNERHKFSREIGIRKMQNHLLTQNYDSAITRLIVFLVPGSDWATGRDNISGGVLSIASLYGETRAIESVHQSKLIMCTFPLDHLLLRHTNFENDIDVYRFSQLQVYFRNLKELTLHIPEFLVEHFEHSTSSADKHFLKGIPSLQINILNQNIKLMPSREVIDSLRSFTQNITMTTAHKKYCTRALREAYGVPLHFFSTFASPEGYVFSPYAQKENLLLLSPDDAEKNREVIELLKGEIPGLQTRVINGLTYDAYKELIGRAKWSITFGEGLDFYFIEPVFSGAVSFAIYNEDFFTPDFKEIKTVYSSYAELKERLVADLAALDNEHQYSALQQQQFLLCSKYYSKEQYRKNIATFYNRRYTFA
jgi:hypothetical protein